MIGQTVSHYRILEKIGSGGMGEIYLAEDTKLKRQVALKFLPRQMTADTDARERFEREAQAAAALNHPNIVTIHEIGEHEGQVFIAMEYVEGQTLKELITVNRQPSTVHRPPSTVNRLPISQVLEIATQICSGLAAAHARGIVHRDIKPQNIVVAPGGRAKILDFGLAKLKGASPLTKESSAYGTVHYMSPEQGLGREVDPRSDIWSLGVVLYEMLAGTPPFHGEYEQAVIYAIINEETPPLPDPVRQERPGLEEIVCRCLAKRREERYSSANELAAALEGLRPGKMAAPAGKSRRLRLRRPVLAAAVVLLAALGLVLLAPWARVPMRRVLGLAALPEARHIAVLPLQADGGADAALLADGFSALVADKLTWMEKFHDAIWTCPAESVFRRRGRSAGDLQRLLGCNLFLAGRLRVENGSLDLELQVQDARSQRRLKRVELRGSMANLSVFQEGLPDALLRLLELPAGAETVRYVNFGGTSMPGAYVLYLKGRGALLAEGDAGPAGRGIEFLEKALRQDDGYILARLALLAGLRARFKRTRDPGLLTEAAEQGLPARKAAGDWPPARLAWGMLQNDMGRKTEAQAAFLSALQGDERNFAACIELAWGSMTAGNASEAERFFKRAVQLRRGYPTALYYLAYFYGLNGRNEEAIASYEEVTRLAPGDARAFSNLGGLYLMKGERAKAMAMFEKANAIQPDAAAQSNLATLYFFDGDYRKALPLYSALARETDDFIMWGNLADTFRQLPEQRGKAVSAYQKAIALAGELLAKEVDSQKLSEITSCLAIYYAHLGERDKALAAIVRARALAPTNLEIIRRAILVYEATGERSQSLNVLREYRERLGGMDEIEREPDLAALRADPSYREILGSPH